MSEKVIIEYEVKENGVLQKTRMINDNLRDTEKAGGKAKLGLSSVAIGAAAAAAAVYGAARTIMGAGSQIISVGSQFETLGIQMKAVTGSSAAAEQAMSWIEKFVLTTPYQLGQVSDQFVKLKAMGLDPMDGTLQAVADSTSKLGGSMEVMESITLALGKANAKTKLSMEEMNMMMERGVPVLDILADRLGKNTDQIVEMSSKGQLGRDAIQELIKGMQDWAGPASQDLMDTFAGKWSNLQDYITAAWKEISDAGVLDAVKGILDDLIKTLKDAIDSGVLTEFGKQIADGLKAIAPVISGLATALFEFVSFLTKVSIKSRESLYGINLEMVQQQIESLTDSQQRMLEKYGAVSMMNAEQREDWKNLGTQLQGAKKKYEELLPKLQDQEDALERLQAALKKVTEESDSLTTSTENTGNAAGAAAEKIVWGTKQFLSAGTEAWDTFLKMADDVILKIGPKGPVLLGWVNTGKQMGSVYDKTMDKLKTSTDGAMDVIGKSFSDLVSKGFMGEFENLGDLWDSLWQDLAKSMVTILGDALAGWADGSVNSGSFNPTMLGSLSTAIGPDAPMAQRIGAGIGGAGMIYGGYQQGGSGGILQGALGGAMAGFAMGGVPGAIAGAVAGAVLASFGNGNERAWTGANISLREGSFANGVPGSFLNTENQGISREGQELWMTARQQEYRQAIQNMNQILRLFNDADLFDLIGEGGDFNFGGEGSIDQVATIFREQWLPEAMRQMFEGAINRGLGDLGVTQATIDRLWEELSATTGSAQIEHLETFIGSLVGLTDLWKDMDWDTILDTVRQDSITAFLGGLNDIAENVELQMLGLEDMTLLERAEQAKTIEQLITQARSAEIDMLRQLDQMQQSISQSLQRQIEGIEVGGMSNSEKQKYYQDRITDIMAQLRGGVSSPEQLQQLIGDLQRYASGYQGTWGDQFYTTFRNREFGYEFNPSQWITDLLTEAQGLSDDAFAGWRDAIKDANDRMVDLLEQMLLALQDWNGDLTSINPDGIDPKNINVPVTVNVQINGDKSLFVKEVRAIVHAELNRTSSGRAVPHGVN